MKQDSLQKLPHERREPLEQVLALQAAMAEAVERGDWDETRALESRRAEQLRAVYASPQTMGPEAGEALADITRDLIRADKALVERVMEMRRSLNLELTAVRKGQKAVGAYADNGP